MLVNTNILCSAILKTPNDDNSELEENSCGPEWPHNYFILLQKKELPSQKVGLRGLIAKVKGGGLNPLKLPLPDPALKCVPWKVDQEVKIINRLLSVCRQVIEDITDECGHPNPKV